jgi:hypothetical protein
MGGRNLLSCRTRWTQIIDPKLNRGQWTAQEDALLLDAYAKSPNKWVTIRNSLPDRCDKDIKKRHQSLTRPEPVRIRWTATEDSLLAASVAKHGTRVWSKVAEEVPGRTRKQCVGRWGGTLTRHGKSNGAWTEADDALLAEGVNLHGEDGKWAAIADTISGKTGWECKTRWERELSRMLNASPWSSEEDAIIVKMRDEGRTWNKIIHHLPGRGGDAIKKRCEELGKGIQPAPERWSPKDMEALRVALLPYEGKRKRWKKIVEGVPGKTVEQCINRLRYQD